MTQNSVNKNFVKKDDRSRGVHSSKTVKLTAVGQSCLRSGLWVVFWLQGSSAFKTFWK